MLFTRKTVSEKRADLNRLIHDGRLHQFPGAFNPLCARLIERKGFPGVYISGAVLSADLCLPDIGIATLSEFADRGRQIARVTDLPAIIDIDTGFGETMSVARTVRLMEEAGICGCHIEDQVMPKRCGHLDGKELVDTKTMVQRVRAAADARLDSKVCLIARTDARAVEGLGRAIERMKAYVDAGADMIFPEALENEREFEVVRSSLDVPLLANMTEFGKSRLLNRKELENLGYNVVIYPVTTLRLAMGEVDRGLDVIKANGDQYPLVDRMQHRKELYDLLSYERYNQFDLSLFNFEVEGKQLK